MKVYIIPALCTVGEILQWSVTTSGLWYRLWVSAHDDHDDDDDDAHDDAYDDDDDDDDGCDDKNDIDTGWKNSNDYLYFTF